MEDDLLTSTQAKLWLLHVYYLYLPRPLLREVSTYIGAAILLLPIFTSSIVHLYDIQSHSIRSASIARSLMNWSFCHISELRVLCLGYGSRKDNVYSLHLSSLELTLLRSMSKGRLSPGVGKVGRWAYAFGGSTGMTVPCSSSCERFNYQANVWQQLPNMPTAKARFQPCAALFQIYLCYPTSNIEIFDTHTDTFSQLNIRFQTYTSGSLSFLVGDTVNILTTEKCLIRWRIGGETWSEEEVKMDSGLLALSKCAVMKAGLRVYWSAGICGEVIELDTEILTTIEVRSLEQT
jgi:hypothetical protein